MTGDPWLEAMLDDVYDRLGAMTKARGAGEFSAEESARYWALVCELTEIDHAIRDGEPRARPAIMVISSRRVSLPRV
jgi:hypothetical protein